MKIKLTQWKTEENIRKKGEKRSSYDVKVTEAEEVKYPAPVSLGVIFTVMGKPDLSVLLPTK